MGFLRELFGQPDEVPATDPYADNPVVYWRVKGAEPGTPFNRSTVIEYGEGVIRLGWWRPPGILSAERYRRDELEIRWPKDHPEEPPETAVPAVDREAEAAAYEKGVADTLAQATLALHIGNAKILRRRVQFELLREAVAERRRIFGVFGEPPREAEDG